MKLFLMKIGLFFIALAVIDILFGHMCQYMNDNSKGGGIKSRYYICKESTEDILVFGSSRAKHHYVPDIIEDSLGFACYNAGEDGNGIVLSYGFLKMLTQRYSPKLIIYDVTGFDMYKDDNLRYLDLLKPYYYEPGIDSIFWSVNPKSRYLMMSNLYRFNTTCLRIIGGYFHPTTDHSKGYIPLYRIMDYEPIIEKDRISTVDTLKCRFFEEFIRLVKDKNVRLVCCVSPYYKAPADDGFYEPVKELCRQNDITFVYLGAASDITNNSALFQDRTHMNEEGAMLFTRELISYLK